MWECEIPNFAANIHGVKLRCNSQAGTKPNFRESGVGVRVWGCTAKLTLTVSSAGQNLNVGAYFYFYIFIYYTSLDIINSS